MMLVIQIALGIVLACFVYSGVLHFCAWYIRKRTERLYAPPRPAYRPAAPGVEYDREGTAINTVPGARPGGLSPLVKVLLVCLGPVGWILLSFTS